MGEGFEVAQFKFAHFFARMKNPRMTKGILSTLDFKRISIDLSDFQLPNEVQF